MKKFKILLLMIVILNVSAPVFAYDKQDYKEIAKITKTLRKLSDKGEIEKLSGYFSENYKSFDGYDKREMMKIFAAANKLYPNSKTKEKINKFEENGELITIYIDETSKTKLTVDGKNAMYAAEKKVKGELKSISSYSMTFKNENNNWKVITDEIFSETTEIRYGEAIGVDYRLETPENIAPGEEFTVKTVVDIPKDRYVVGSIGHDKIIFPPQKYLDPYRTIDDSGILERVMVANKDGINEYANSTFAYITVPERFKSLEDAKEAGVSGMGICVKRINVIKKQPL